MRETVFEGGREPLLRYFKRVFKSRRLIVSLAWRDIRVTYAQTFLGILWAAVQPITGLLIFSLFFGLLIKLDTGPTPYPIFAFTGLTSWYLFSAILRSSGNSLILSQDLIRNLNFPRLILPLSKGLSNLPEFGISMLILGILMVSMGIYPGWQIVFLPIFILLNLFAGLTIGIWLSALTLRYRDFQHFIPYIVNFGIWLTPVFYPTTILPPKYNFVLFFNPMAGIVQGFRWSLLGGEAPDIRYVITFAVMLLIMIFGIIYFRKIEKMVTDFV